jgi:excisionase family DNA binding protein
MSLMTFKEALAFLRISNRTLRTMVYSRQIPFHKMVLNFKIK